MLSRAWPWKLEPAAYRSTRRCPTRVSPGVRGADAQGTTAAGDGRVRPAAAERSERYVLSLNAMRGWVSLNATLNATPCEGGCPLSISLIDFEDLDDGTHRVAIER